MANSSSKHTCFQCTDADSPNFRNGWRFRDGQFAQLCNRCATLYEDGLFCETFHSKSDGWTVCESCKKLVHCGCIASFNQYMLLDTCGVICIKCWAENFRLARKESILAEKQLENERHMRVLEKDVKLDPEYWPRMTSAEIDEVAAKNTYVLPLFEKLISPRDADPNLGFLSIPKQCAEAFFPKCTPARGCPIKIKDTEGNKWNCILQCWNTGSNEIYVLEGLKGHMVSKQWETNDVVTFYRVGQEQELVMGLRKTHSCE